ncbi:transketolase, pyrimidine binding domain protein, partial [Chlamydia psittaci 02DC22]
MPKYVTLEIREAIREAIDEEMARDPNVCILGEEVAEYNGAYKVTKGLLDKWSSSRVIDTPISEAAFAGIGIGAALTGLRPIIEFMSWNFSLVAADQIISHAAKMHYMTGGIFSVPIVF